MTTATVHDTARQQIERAASQPTALYAQPAIVAAAALLEAWLVAADRRSVLAAAYRAELAARLAAPP
jgi:hypothetical protein